MSRIVYFTVNGAAGFQLSTDVMDTLQMELQDLISAFICVVGNDVILCGVVGPTGGVNYTDGLIIWNNEFLYFEGGVFAQYLVINEQITELTFCDENIYDAYKVRTARFQASILPGDEYIEVTNVPGLGVFTTINNLVTMNANIATNTTNISTNLTNLTNQINALTTIVNNNALLDNSEIGDVKYLKNITNFDAQGLGMVGTNRAGWALVTDLNTDWSTALGYGGTFASIDGRTVVIAGNTYAVLNTFGVDDVTLTGAQSGTAPHNHGNTGAGGDHSHDVVINKRGPNIGGSNFIHSLFDPDTATDNRGVVTITNVADAEGRVVTQSGTHTHSTANSASVAASASHENRQPSIALYMAVKYQ